MRDANSKISKTKGLQLHVGVFVGTPTNCTKIQEVESLISALQGRHPDLPIETFVIPIPRDEVSAELMRRTLFDNITAIFETAHPVEDDLN